MKDACAEEGGAGDGEDPGEDDAARYTPADGGKAAGSADADDGAGDGVGGADGDAEMGGAHQGESAGGFGGKSAEGGEIGDALAHGLDDAPAAGHGAACHGQVTADDDPVGDIVGLHEAAGDEGGGDDAHAFLGVVGAVAEAVARGRKQLQAAEPAVDFERALTTDNPTG